MQLLISEILEKAASQGTPKDKANILRAHGSPALQEVLKYTYDPKVTWYCQKAPAYTPDPAPEGLAFTNLMIEYRRLYVFQKDNPVSEKRKNELLIQLLESVHPSEAKTVEQMIEGEIPGLPREVVDIAFPNLISTKAVKA
jgi:hypothetical protein